MYIYRLFTLFHQYSKITRVENKQEIKKYFNKILNTISIHYSFRLFDYYFIEKRRIDDVLCCLLAIIPKSYIDMVNLDIAIEQERMCSIKAYKSFLEVLKTPAPFSSAHYLLSKNKIQKDIDNLLPLLVKDLEILSKE